MKNTTLFIIDDEKGIRMMLKEVFARSGYNVFTYSNPLDAKVAINEKKPAIILVDYRIPEMKGDQFAHEIREEGWKIPVILMTGTDKEEMHNIVRTGEIVEIVEKPFNIVDIVQIVEKNLYDFVNISE
ncbi:response regulator [Allobacillus sp. GCM10007491]|uniref:Response regulator n=1 Tax=Allobacillus saliphilus TaxID=2912308 RepID=A0A941CWS7_9BACI|nr:response regulator [Allobacillus saliphilus]MBR7554071.1 response regulator [Allobacillus saliphilus]